MKTRKSIHTGMTFYYVDCIVCGRPITGLTPPTVRVCPGTCTEKQNNRYKEEAERLAQIRRELASKEDQ